MVGGLTAKDVFERISKHKEILKLNTMLDNAKIPHRTHRLDDGWQVIYAPYHPDSWEKHKKKK